MTANKPHSVAPPPVGADDIFHAPVVTRGPNVAEIEQRYHTMGKVAQTDIADILRAICTLHEALGEDLPSAFRSNDSTPVPNAVLVIAIAALTGEWTLQKANADRAENAKELRAQRDEIVQTGVSKREASRRVLQKESPDLDPDTFRKRQETLRKK